jgi:acyl-ACP thioesterase
MVVPEPEEGRVFRGERRVRLADADPGGRLRFDAAARYLQDVSNDDTRDARLTDDGSWVVRRTELVVSRSPRFLERVALATWCGGTGSRWAERRVSVAGVKGGSVEATSLWVYVDLDSMLPKRLGADFMALYGPAAGGRTVGSKLVLSGPQGASVERRAWPLRATDIDVLGHVNNAAYWAAVEEIVADRPELVAGPHEATVEFAKPIDRADDVTLLVANDERSATVWFEVAGKVRATAHLSAKLHLPAPLQGAK